MYMGGLHLCAPAGEPIREDPRLSFHSVGERDSWCAGDSGTIFAGLFPLADRKTRKPFNLRFETKPPDTLPLHRLETPSHCFSRWWKWRGLGTCMPCGERTEGKRSSGRFRRILWRISRTAFQIRTDSTAFTSTLFPCEHFAFV